jgi:hypothetical protein
LFVVVLVVVLVVCGDDAAFSGEDGLFVVTVYFSSQCRGSFCDVFALLEHTPIV